MSASRDPKTIKALVLDLDGTTIAPGFVLSERCISAVKKCLQRGLGVIIATGRALEASEKYRAAFGAEGPMIYLNGALVAEMPGGKILSAAMLDAKLLDFCVDLSREMGIYYQVFFPNGSDADGGDASRIKLMAERDGPERELYHKHTGISIELTNLKEALRQYGAKGCYKSIFIADPERVAVLRPRLEEHFGDSVYIVQSLPIFLEVMDPKASKGRALSFVMEKLSLKREEVIAFGDEENDLSMFAAAGFAVAPANARDAVKARADRVTGANTEDGVAAFLEEFFGL
jgi:Cof subfamily protein (haloacid dehalogenase superfamily)